MVLRVSRIVGGRPLDGGDEPRRQGRDAAEPLEEVERGALERQDRTDRAGDLRDHGPRLPADRRRPGTAASRR